MRFLLIPLILVGISSSAQVSNNSIHERSVLNLDEAPIHSTTAQATVEWTCINKALTKKCLVYHNDQWFSFRLHKDGRSYINISSQKCRDFKGIQLIIIEGNPCEVATYKIHECIPMIRQEDVFVDLGNLKAEITYLVNIDGFLGDFCEFDIQLSSHHSGLPRSPLKLETQQTSVVAKDSIVAMDWTLTQEIAYGIGYFTIFRKRYGESKAEKIAAVPSGFNAYGAPDLTYHLLDTLRYQGDYNYQIFGVLKTDEIPALITERKVSFWKKELKSKKTSDFTANIELNYPNGTPFEVIIYDREKEKKLWAYAGDFNFSDHHAFQMTFEEWIKSGIKKFMVLTTDGRAHREFYFRIDQEGFVRRE